MRLTRQVHHAEVAPGTLVLVPGGFAPLIEARPIEGGRVLVRAEGAEFTTGDTFLTVAAAVPPGHRPGLAFQKMVRDCPRCGGNHVGLLFRPRAEGGPGQGNYRAKCPRTKKALSLE